MLIPLNICQVITCKPELIRKIKAFEDVTQLRTFKQDYFNLREGHYILGSVFLVLMRGEERLSEG